MLAAPDNILHIVLRLKNLAFRIAGKHDRSHSNISYPVIFSQFFLVKGI